MQSRKKCNTHCCFFECFSFLFTLAYCNNKRFTQATFSINQVETFKEIASRIIIFTTIYYKIVTYMSASFLSKKNKAMFMLRHVLEKKYVFKGQRWNYRIAAKNHSCSPLQYAVYGQRYGMNISSTGLITWIPSEVKVYEFTISVKDPCGLIAFQQLTVDVRNCFCKGKINTRCIWKNPMHLEDGIICTCPDGCSGERFE